MGPVKDVKEEGRVREIDREIENIAVLRQLLRRSQLFTAKITKKRIPIKKEEGGERRIRIIAFESGHSAVFSIQSPSFAHPNILMFNNLYF